MALYLINETKSFKEPKENINKSIPKCRCNLTLKSKAFYFINLPKILRSREVCDTLLFNFDISHILMVVNISKSLLDRSFFH